MSPDEAIAGLDDALAEAGQSCILRRIVGTPGSQSNVDVAVKAFVRSPSAAELIAGFEQSDSRVILSFSEILAAGWPSGQPAGAVHPEIPRGGSGGDKLVVLGIARNIEVVNPIMMADTFVRLELQVRGG